MRTTVYLLALALSGGIPSPALSSPTDSLRLLADSLSAAGDYRGAHNASSIATELVAANSGTRSAEFAAACVYASGLKLQLGLLDEADEQLRSALEIYRAGEGSVRELGNCLDRLGTVNHYRGKNEIARPLLEEAVAIFESHGPDTSLAGVLNNFSLVARVLRDTDAAADAARRALTILIRDVPDHRGIPYVLNNLANLHVDLGEYAIAEPLYRESIAMRQQYFGPEHPQVATALSNLAHVLRYQGNEPEAETMLREVWRIRKGVNESHPDVGRSMMNLANCLREQGRLNEAESLLDHALVIHRETLGEDHPSYMRNLASMADLLFSKEDYSGARVVYEEVLAENREILPALHPHVASNMGMIARCAEAMEDSETDSLYVAAMEEWTARLGPNHVNTLACKIGRVRFLLNEGRPDESLALLEEIVPGYELARIRLQPGPKRSKFIDSPYLLLARTHLELGNAGDAWNAMERSSGRVFFDLLYEADGFPWTAEEREELARRNDVWDKLEQRAATLELAGDDSPNPEHSDIGGKLYQAEADYLSYRNSLTAKYGSGVEIPLSWREVQSRMPEGDVLIGWLDLSGNAGRGTSWAAVLRNEGEPEWRQVKPLTTMSGAPVTSTWAEMLAVTGEWPFLVSDTRRSDELGLAVGKERIGPIADLIEGARHLVILPGSGVVRFPVEAIPDGSGQFVGDRFTVSYASSGTTYLALQSRKAPAGSQTLLIGAPMLHGEEEAIPLLTSISSDILPRALAGDRAAILALPSLPEASAEIRKISAIVRAPLSLIAEDASEHRLRQLAETGKLADFRWIHFATHTLIDEGDADGSLIVLSQTGLADPLAAAIEGISRDDGLLTAREIIREWRIDADLVTLSSCRSALGVASPGDGFLGLSQGFCYAGARSVVVSLWPVDDRASSILMGEFYRSLASGLSKADALWLAKQKLRGHGEGREQPFQHPAYWAAFILHGAS